MSSGLIGGGITTAAWGICWAWVICCECPVVATKAAAAAVAAVAAINALRIWNLPMSEDSV
jgi:hypothetical protein